MAEPHHHADHAPKATGSRGEATEEVPVKKHNNMKKHSDHDLIAKGIKGSGGTSGAQYPQHTKKASLAVPGKRKKSRKAPLKPDQAVAELMSKTPIITMAEPQRPWLTIPITIRMGAAEMTLTSSKGMIIRCIRSRARSTIPGRPVTQVIIRIIRITWSEEVFTTMLLLAIMGASTGRLSPLRAIPDTQDTTILMGLAGILMTHQDILGIMTPAEEWDIMNTVVISATPATIKNTPATQITLATHTGSTVIRIMSAIIQAITRLIHSLTTVVTMSIPDTTLMVIPIVATFPHTLDIMVIIPGRQSIMDILTSLAYIRARLRPVTHTTIIKATPFRHIVSRFRTVILQVILGVTHILIATTPTLIPT
ncbi:hypothetical protein BV898_08866 [Hypsibius exemplaris]|uniref:Uncharacterized protein n=1 Tax=Hypsibius exemplaris TaxID=2072580 RepID=A0A1W0WP67_HYPEX|nr:hypothetical protein BV898_08866 [Hypsibius exemplaris]